MPGDDGLWDEMYIRPTHPGFEPDPAALDERAVERLLAGRLDTAEVPPDYARVAELLAAAAAPSSSDELAGWDAAAAAFASAARPDPPRVGRRRPTPRHGLVGVKLAAAVVIVVLSLAGVAAAASGTLPDPAQRMLHNVLGGAGVPGPGEGRTPPHRGPSSSRRPAAGGQPHDGGQGIPSTARSQDGRDDQDHGAIPPATASEQGQGAIPPATASEQGQGGDQGQGDDQRSGGQGSAPGGGNGTARRRAQVDGTGAAGRNSDGQDSGNDKVPAPTTPGQQHDRND